MAGGRQGALGPGLLGQSPGEGVRGRESKASVSGTREQPILSAHIPAAQKSTQLDTHTHTHNASDCHSLPSHRRVLLARPLEKTPWQISRNQTLPIRLVLGESAGTGGTAGAKEVRTHGQPLSPHLCLRWIRYSRAWGLQFCVCGFFSFFFNLWVGIRSHLLLGNILIPTLTLFLRKLKVGKTQGVEKKEGSKLGD